VFYRLNKLCINLTFQPSTRCVTPLTPLAPMHARPSDLMAASLPLYAIAKAKGDCKARQRARRLNDVDVCLY
jgi:hypothetical protein